MIKDIFIIATIRRLEKSEGFGQGRGKWR